MNPVDVIGLGLQLTALALIAFYIVPKQIIAVVTNTRDWLTTLRWQLLGSFAVILLASVPGIIIRVMRSSGTEPPEFLLDIARITGSLSFLIFTVLWVLIYLYREKDQK